MLRGEEEIKQDVIESVANGVVTLNSSVPNRMALRAARNAAYHTAGVIDVCDNLAITV